MVLAKDNHEEAFALAIAAIPPEGKGKELIDVDIATEKCDEAKSNTISITKDSLRSGYSCSQPTRDHYFLSHEAE
jgi:hypothetical protein